MPGIGPAGHMIRRIEEDVQRNLLRARNGIRHASGIDRTRVGQSPKETVWRRDKCELWRYRSDTVDHTPPILVVLSMISRSYILDLRPGNSLVERLRDAGFDVFLLDWGMPDQADSANAFETYVDDYVPRAVKAVLAVSGATEVTLTGYCLGGVVALLVAAKYPELPIRNLVCIATPIDFDHMGLLADLLRENRLDVDTLIDQTGNIPPSIIHNAFRLRRPTGDLVQYANLWENLWNDEFLAAYEAMSLWTRDHVPFPGDLAREIVIKLVRENSLFRGRFRVGGRRVQLRNVTCPFLHIIAERDDVVPLGSTAPLVGLVGTAQPDELRIPAGHVALLAGRQAATVTTPALLDWLRARSDTMPTPRVRRTGAARPPAARRTPRSSARRG